MSISSDFLSLSVTYFHIQRGQYTGVCAALKFFRQTDNVERDMTEMDREDAAAAAAASAATDADDATDTRPYTMLQLLRASDLRRPLFIACTLQVIQQFSGINAVK